MCWRKQLPLGPFEGFFLLLWRSCPAVCACLQRSTVNKTGNTLSPSPREVRSVNRNWCLVKLCPEWLNVEASPCLLCSRQTDTLLNEAVVAQWRSKPRDTDVKEMTLSLWLSLWSISLKLEFIWTQQKIQRLSAVCLSCPDVLLLKSVRRKRRQSCLVVQVFDCGQTLRLI